MSVSEARFKSIVGSAVQTLPADTDPTPYANWALVMIDPATVVNLNALRPLTKEEAHILQDKIDADKATGVVISSVQGPISVVWPFDRFQSLKHPLNVDGLPVVELTGPWLVPFSIAGIRLGDLYNLVVVKLSIHGRVFDSLCDACDMNLVCFSEGRTNDRNFKCPSLWRSVRRNRAIANDLAQQKSKSSFRIHP